jgi:hypothetical protein
VKAVFILPLQAHFDVPQQLCLHDALDVMTKNQREPIPVRPTRPSGRSTSRSRVDWPHIGVGPASTVSAPSSQRQTQLPRHIGLKK